VSVKTLSSPVINLPVFVVPSFHC